MPTKYAKVKKEVFDELAKTVTFERSGRQAAETIWKKTLGNFFRRYGSAADAKWAIPRVRNYAMRAVTRIAQEANVLSNGKPVKKSHMNKAAKDVVKEFRRICPPEVDTGAQTTALHGELCELF